MPEALDKLPAGADRLAYVDRKGPNVALLQQEYDNAWEQGSDTRSGVWNLVTAEDVRYNRWKGRCWDGLKHAENMGGKECRPYDGAPDTRIPLADETIEAVVDILFVSFYGARVNPYPVHASRLTAQECAEWRSVVNWMLKGPLRRDLINQVEFLAQMAHTFGWCVLHPTWEQQHAMQTQRLTMVEITQFAAQAPEGSLMRQVPAMVVASGSDKEQPAGKPAKELVTGDGEHIQDIDESPKGIENQLVEIFTGLFDGLKERDARKAIIALREKGVCEFDIPLLVSNGPRLWVLVPGIDFISPREMTDPQTARVLFTRWEYTTAQLEAKIVDEDWDPDFVEAAMSTAGQSSVGDGTVEQFDDDNSRMIEIVTSFAFQVVDNVPGIYCTIFSPNLRTKGGTGAVSKDDQERKYTETDGPLFARHYLLQMAHREQPFMVYQTEVIGKRPDDSRGIPEKLVTQQMEMKRQRDALFIRAEMETTPPLLKIGARASKLPPEFGPLAIFNMARSGEWEWFSPPNGNPELAFKLFEQIKLERDEQHGLPNPKISPMRWQARQKRQVMRWLQTWGHTLWQLSVLAYENLSAQELEEVIGHPPMLTPENILKFTLAMDYDVRSLDPDWVSEMTEKIAGIIAMDTGGTVDHSKLVGLLLSYLDSTLADEVMTDQKGAAKKVFDDVRNQLSLMMQGNEADYVENDPTAKMKLQFLQQSIQANPDYIMALHPQSLKFDKRKAELVKKYGASLTQSVTQQDNKLVGRIGVKPEAMEKAQG